MAPQTMRIRPVLVRGKFIVKDAAAQIKIAHGNDYGRRNWS